METPMHVETRLRWQDPPQNQRDRKLKRLWRGVKFRLEELRRRGVSRYENISPSKDHWLASATGVSGCAYNLIFSKNEARVELYLQRSQAENKWIFDHLERKRQEIEERFGAELQWLRILRESCHPFYAKVATCSS